MRRLLTTLLIALSASATAFGGPLSQTQRDLRIDHAQELLGSKYKKSAVRSGERIKKVNGAVYRWVKDALPSKYRKDSHRIAQAIIDESLKYGFDPVFVLSLIHTESSFNPGMIGGVGEIGLMQIRPETAEWLADKKNFRWKGKASLKDPVTNIQIGCAYVDYLRERFDSHARLYLAAYNMGPTGVKNLLAEDKWPTDYPSRIMKYYVGYYEELREKNSKDRKVASN